ncbi:MAG: dihydroorotate dehydrogenase [Pseudomonadota bacterium]
MSERNELDERALGALFAAARDVAPQPSDALVARILADAAAETAPAPAPRRSGPREWLSDWLEAIGGWPSAAGLVTATAAGVWLGLSSPELVSPFGLSATEFDLVDLVPGVQTGFGG